MKKLATLSLVSVLSVTMAACGQAEKKAEATSAEAGVQNVKEQAAAMDHSSNHSGEAAAAMSEPVVKTESGIAISSPFARPTHPGQKVSSAYFNLSNPTDKDVEVTSISSNVANITEFHAMEMKNSKMIMRKLDEVIIPAGGEFVMSTGGNHVMLIELAKPLMEGDEVTINLELSNGEKLALTTKVSAMEDKGQKMNHDSH